MSKSAYISRYMLILKKLKAKPYSSYQELFDYISGQFEFFQMQNEDLQTHFSKRTMQRDIREIRNMFGIDIEYSPSQRGYHITNAEHENMNFQRMIEAYDMFNSLNIAGDLTPYIHLENRRPQGTENLHGLLHAIKNKREIKFTYLKFWEEEISKRRSQPLALKEFRNRWYVIAKDEADDRIKTFALDRLLELEITSRRFKYPADFNIDDYFRYSFGIISPTDEKPQHILLSFDPYQAKYIKTLPLHPSQEIVLDNPEEVQIKLHLCITHDLLMELLSFGANVKVIKPVALRNLVRKAHLEAFELYSS